MYCGGMLMEQLGERDAMLICGRNRLRQEGAALGRRATPVQWHRKPYRKRPDRRVSLLYRPWRQRVYRPRTVCAQTSVNVAGRRWEIETGFEATKGECGLDQYKVRRRQGW